MSNSLLTATTSASVVSATPRTVYVLAQSADGPTFFSCSVTGDAAFFDDGCHCEVAKGQASKAGYEGPMFAFDENDPAGQRLKKAFAN